MTSLIKAITVIAMILVPSGCVVARPYHRMSCYGGYYHGDYYCGYPHRVR